MPGRERPRTPPRGGAAPSSGPIPARLPIQYLFESDDGYRFQVDADLWLCALDLAVMSGWKPLGLDAQPAPPAPGAEGDWDRLDYGTPSGQRVGAEDASNLSSSLRAGLDLVPDAEVPMRGKTFGEENTRSLIGKAFDGRTIRRPKLPAAAEILSGRPKVDARALADFLARGGFTMHGVPTRA